MVVASLALDAHHAVLDRDDMWRSAVFAGELDPVLLAVADGAALGLWHVRRDSPQYLVGRLEEILLHFVDAAAHLGLAACRVNAGNPPPGFWLVEGERRPPHLLEFEGHFPPAGL